MTIYADTSFLVSLLYAKDSGHSAAHAEFVRHGGAEWQTSEWSRLETINSLRQLCRQYSLKPEVPEALRRYFKHLHRHGQFSELETNMAEAVRECHQLSAAHGATMVVRMADALHVALMEQINPDLFVTRDKNQAKLAAARAIKCNLVP